MFRFSIFCVVSLLAASSVFAETYAPKVVVMAMFEHGEPTGDKPGELQAWVERYPMPERIPFPLGQIDLHWNADDDVLVVLTGGGVTHATATIMALGTDPRFDFTQSYWLVAGIAGGDPEDVSLGTAAWARWVVDGDLLYEVDAREMPGDWPYGLIPLGAKKPNDISTGWTVDNIVFELNAGLAHWAYGVTKDYPVADHPEMADFRELFVGLPNAQTPPRVVLGDTMSASTYWHGEKLNRWANDWMKLHTGGKGEFMTTNMEDTGTLTALRRLRDVGRVDLDRVMVLRTASNFSMQPPGKSAGWSTTAPYPAQGRPALDAAYEVGSRVVRALVDDWATYATTIPSAPEPAEAKGNAGPVPQPPAGELHADDGPIEIKVVVVAMFERGEDTGDQPGEFQYWVERLPLDERVPFPQGGRDLRLNRAQGVLGMVTGIGTFKSASAVMALGLDPRFDLTNAYWLIAGISGADPEDMSLGSAAWAEWVIDGDLAHEIDEREIDSAWPTGYIPLRGHEPYQQPLPANDEGVRYRLHSGLVDWAFQLTKDTPLADNEDSAILRTRYVNYPTAQRPPFVLKGDQLAAMTFWHGKRHNDWANAWVDYWSEGTGNFVTSAMEDTGTLQALTRLQAADKVDLDRVLVLRTASNFVMQHAGLTAAESLSGEKKGGYSAYIPSLENAYRVGMRVVDALVADWATYRETLPSAE